MRRAALLLLLLAGAPAGAAEPSFCERLAPKLSMKPKAARDGGAPTYEVNLLGGLKSLFGGSTILSFAVGPVGEPTVADYQRLAGVCVQGGKEITCTIAEPMTLKVQAGTRTADEEAKPGEKAVVASRKTSITCRDGAG